MGISKLLSVILADFNTSNLAQATLPHKKCLKRMVEDALLKVLGNS